MALILSLLSVLTDILRTLTEAAAVAWAASWIALLFHEAGHVFAARLVNVRVWSVRLGMGPTLWRGVIAGARVHLGLLPLLGAVRLLDEDASAIGYRDISLDRWRFVWGPDAWRAPIISAAGGLSNLVALLLTIIGWNATGRPEIGTFAGDLVVITLGANLAGYLNLLPCFRSDGIHLLAHVRAARLQLAATVAS
jgi:membrane-associated protease RseP (regulator of RpoE activity)